MPRALSFAIFTHFENLTEPRVKRTQVHKLLDILVIALCGAICGANTWVDVERFGLAKWDWFARFLELPGGIPSHDTFGRVFSASSDHTQRSLLLAPNTLQPNTGYEVRLVYATDIFTPNAGFNGATSEIDFFRETDIDFVPTVPEPSSLVLLAAGGVGLLACIRRRSRVWLLL